MMNKKDEITNYLGIILFVILQFLVISSFSNKSADHRSGSFQCELKSEFHSNPPKAVIVDQIQNTSIQRSCIHILYNANLNLFSETFKVFADNNKILLRIIALHRTELLIKPIHLVRFYFPPILMNSEEFPILS